MHVTDVGIIKDLQSSVGNEGDQCTLLMSALSKIYNQM